MKNMLKTVLIRKKYPFINKKFLFLNNIHILYLNPNLLLSADADGGVFGLFR